MLSRAPISGHRNISLSPPDPSFPLACQTRAIAAKRQEHDSRRIYLFSFSLTALALHKTRSALLSFVPLPCCGCNSLHILPLDMSGYGDDTSVCCSGYFLPPQQHAHFHLRALAVMEVTLLLEATVYVCSKSPFHFSIGVPTQ